MSHPTRTRLPEKAAPLLLLAIVCIFYWRLTLTRQSTWLDSPDLVNQVLPWFQLQAREWHSGRVPLWDPTSWSGQPLFGEALPGAAYPLNWLLLWLPLDHGFLSLTALNWYYVLVRFFAAWTAYALCRSLNRSVSASLVGGCLYALGGFIAGTAWPQIFNAPVWLPLVFLFLLRAVRNRNSWRDGILSGFFLGLSWLTGHHQVAMLASLTAFGLWTFFALRQGSSRWQLAKVAVASFAITLLTSGLQTIPMVEYGTRAVRWVSSPNDPLTSDQTVPYSVHQLFALPPQEFLATFLPGFNSGALLFLGITGLTLSVAGGLLGWRRPQVRWISAIAIGGFAFTIGKYSLLHGAMYALVPLIDKSRSPSAAAVLFMLGCAVLSAYGADLLCAVRNASSARMASRWLVACGVILGCFVALTSSLRTAVQPDPRLNVTILAAFASAAILAACSRARTTLRPTPVALLVLLLFELAPTANYVFPNRLIPAENRYLPVLDQHRDVAKFLLEQSGFPRIDFSRKDIPYSFGTWYGIDSIDADGASILADIHKMDLYSDAAKENWGIRYYLGREPNHPQQKLVFEGASGIKVFENPAAHERAWLEHDAPCDSTSEVARLTFHAPNALRIEAHASCPAKVVLSDAWFPGWKASVDGVPAEIEQIHGGVRAVRIQPGSHKIEMRYRPTSVLIGLIMTLTGAAAALWFGLRTRP